MTQLVHHSNVPYDVALTEARQHAVRQFEERIERGKAEGATVLEKILTQVPVDRVGRTSAMNLHVEENGSLVARILEDAEEHRLHANAESQLCTRLGLPVGYFRALKDEGAWGRTFAEETLRTLGRERNPRVLTRSVDGEMRAVLSDAYRRLDSRPLVEAFIKGCEKVGAVPTGGYATDLRVGMRATAPEVIYTAKGDPILCGAEWRNSDFGVGCHDMLFQVERLWCTNRATRTSAMRQVHLGKRLADDEAYSAHTYALDTKVQASALFDLVSVHMKPENIRRQLDAIDKAEATDVSPSRAKALLKEALGNAKAEFEAVGSIYAYERDLTNLPAGENLWRLSNAVSWFSQRPAIQAERRIELEEAAGWLLNARA